MNVSPIVEVFIKQKECNALSYFIGGKYADFALFFIKL